MKIVCIALSIFHNMIYVFQDFYNPIKQRMRTFYFRKNDLIVLSTYLNIYNVNIMSNQLETKVTYHIHFVACDSLLNTYKDLCECIDHYYDEH